MPDSILNDIRRTLAEIASSIALLPETLPSQLPPEATQAIGALIRACDALIAALGPRAGQEAEAEAMLAVARAHRRLLFLALAGADPEHAAPWTEEQRINAPAVAAKVAAGLIPRFYADQHFAETLRAQWLGEQKE